MVKGEEERNYTDNNIAFDEIFNYFLFANFKKIRRLNIKIHDAYVSVEVIKSEFHSFEDHRLCERNVNFVYTRVCSIWKE